MSLLNRSFPSPSTQTRHCPVSASPSRHPLFPLLLTALCLSFPFSTLAQDTTAAAAPADANPPPASPEPGSQAASADPGSSRDTLDTFTVIGGEEEVWNMAGAAAYLDASDFRDQNYTNLNRALGKVPGVYVREEDGYGNFGNISIRGADGTRSTKVTLMEDYILTAPAAYSAPAAYYTPKTARMSGIEILKGSSQIRFGPHTTGGVVNFLSTSIPSDREFYSRNTFGSDATWLSLSHYGDTVVTPQGNFGWLLELHGQGTDGFRDIEFQSGRDTGFSLFEPMFKLSWEPSTTLPQRFELKIGYTDFDADETYLGLTERHVRSRPDLRYASTFRDRIDLEHLRTYLKYAVQPSDALSIETAIYYTDMHRDWSKINRVTSGGANFPLHQALLDPGAVAVLRGLDPGAVRYGVAIREFESYGWQTNATLEFDTGSLHHALTAGLRLHHDQENRMNGRSVTLAADGDGHFTPAGVAPDADILSKADALALHLEDAITLGALTLKPGVRFESIDYASSNLDSDELSLWAGGLGAHYEVDDQNALYGGLYRGVSVPGSRAYLNSPRVDLEESLGGELGWRGRSGGLLAEIAGFFTDYENLIGVDAGLGQGPEGNANAGEAEVWGFEAALSYDPAVERGWSFQLPAYLSVTWTSAELKNALASGGGENIYAGGQPGADIPYVPEWKIAAGIGLINERWGLHLDALYTSESFGTANNASRPRTSAREGSIDSLFTVDLSGHYQVTDAIRLIAGVHNLFDERGIVSRIPEGPRANQGRFFYTGFEATF